jgi:hypothetical protein
VGECLLGGQVDGELGAAWWLEGGSVSLERGCVVHRAYTQSFSVLVGCHARICIWPEARVLSYIGWCMLGRLGM